AFAVDEPETALAVLHDDARVVGEEAPLDAQVSILRARRLPDRSRAPPLEPPPRRARRRIERVELGRRALPERHEDQIAKDAQLARVEPLVLRRCREGPGRCGLRAPGGMRRERERSV